MKIDAELTKAAVTLVKIKCNFTNISFSEASFISNYSHFIKLIHDKVVSKYGCIFLNSTVNKGSILSTIGLPNNISSNKYYNE